MKKLILSAAILLLAGATVSLHAQTEQEMKAFEAYKSPGEMHKLMATWNGTWDATVSFFMDPSAAPVKSQATAVNTMILGGLYQQSVHKGQMFGAPFEGISTLGYDNSRKVFVNTWVDNMGSGIMVLEGKWNEATKTLELSGNSTDPMTGGQIKTRQTMKVPDAKHQVMEMWVTHDGKEMKIMQIDYVKK